MQKCEQTAQRANMQFRPKARKVLGRALDPMVPQPNSRRWVGSCRRLPRSSMLIRCENPGHRVRFCDQVSASSGVVVHKLTAKVP